jgi:hypothetical protein
LKHPSSNPVPSSLNLKFTATAANLTWDIWWTVMISGMKGTKASRYFPDFSPAVMLPKKKDPGVVFVSSLCPDEPAGAFRFFTEYGI